MGEGEFALVRQELEIALGPTLEYVGDHDVYSTIVDVASLQRDEAGIRTYAPAAEEVALRYEHKLYLGVVCRAWSVAHRLAGEFDQAEARLSRALSLFEALGTRWQIGRTLFEQGELALARGRLAEAREYLTLALAQFEAMSARPDAERTRVMLNRIETS